MTKHYHFTINHAQVRAAPRTPSVAKSEKRLEEVPFQPVYTERVDFSVPTDAKAETAAASEKVKTSKG